MRVGNRRIQLWPATLRGRFSVSLALASVLLFLIIYVATALLTGFSLWPTGTDALVDTLAPLGLGGLTLLAGFTLGLLLARVIRSPIERFASHIRTQGDAALEGRMADVSIIADPDLPLELKELSDTVEQLLKQLSLRQADLRDVTERALDSEQIFKTVVNVSSEVKLLIREGLIEVANPAAADFFGLAPDALLGTPLSEALATFAITTASGKPLDAEMLLARDAEESLLVHCLSESGDERWADCMVTHPPDDSGLSLLTMHDVTERRALEQLRGEIVSIVSHDLRAPLTVVSGYLEMLATDVSAEQHVEMVAKARAATSRMAEMLEGLLGAAQAEHGLLSARRTLVSLNSLASEIVSSLPAHPGHEVVIEQRADVSVLADAGRLSQALANLLLNAVRHTPEGTTIVVQVDASPMDALLVVDDDGRGVPAEHRAEIFGRYTRLADAGGDGAGLGLYIVKTVAEGHGGEAFVEESARGGCRFVIRLPLDGVTAP